MFDPFCGCGASPLVRYYKTFSVPNISFYSCLFCLIVRIMAKIHGKFQLSIQNELTDKMKIVCSAEVPMRIQELFSKAIEIISPHIRAEEITIFFTRKKFGVTFANDHVGIYVKNFVAFDLDKLETKHDDMITVAFLEEFAHCLLNIHDEKEVGYKVSEIYPKVIFDGEKYLLKKLP